MRGLSTLYRLACEEEQTLTNSGLVDFFYRLDTASTMAEACPRHIDLSDNVLGDAGAAAFLRTLAVMRWVESVDMRGTGAGPRAVFVLCNVTMCTDRRLMAAAGSRPQADAYQTKRNADAGAGADTAAAPADVFSKDALVAPVPALREVDLRRNPVFQLTSKVLLRGLQHRLRTTAAFVEAHPTARFDLPGLVVRLDMHNVQPTLAEKLMALQVKALRQQERCARRRALASRAEMWRLFCVPTTPPINTDSTCGDIDTDSDVGDVFGRSPASSRSPWPACWPAFHSHTVYRIPEFVPQVATREAGRVPSAVLVGSSVVAPPWIHASAMTPSTQPESFFDRESPLMQVTVRRWNDFMDQYLIAYGCFRASGAGCTAAAQLCLELGADALGVLARSSSSAFVWRRHAEHRAVHAYVAAKARNDIADAADQLDPLELWFSACDREGGGGGGDVHRLHTEELLTHVGKLLRTLYACPSLEASLLARGPFLLPGYLQRLRGWYYQVGASMLDGYLRTRSRPASMPPPGTASEAGGAAHDGVADIASGTPEMLDDIKLLYYRVVALLVTSPLTSLEDKTAAASFDATEQRLATIRHVLVSQLGNGVGSCVTEGVTGQATTDTDAARRRCGAFPVVSVQAQYVLMNDPQAARTWAAAYERPFDDANHTRWCADGDVSGAIEARALAHDMATHCTCGAEHLAKVHTSFPPTRPVHLTLDEPLRRPCAACCHAAIACLPSLLTAPHTAARLTALALAPISSPTAHLDAHEAEAALPALCWLPIEFREFVADLVVRQMTVRRGGSAYVPNMLGRASSIHPPYYPMYHPDANQSPSQTASPCVSGSVDDGVVGLLELLAQMKGDVQRLKDVVGAFEEWYRLQALESFDVTRATAECASHGRGYQAGDVIPTF